MDKKTQNLAWACLPIEARAEIRQSYAAAVRLADVGYTMALEDIFGHHNLTSDTEPSELLFVERVEVQNLIFSLQYRLEALKSKPIPENVGRKHDFIVSEIGSLSGAINNLNKLFGDKCLPDKEPSVQGEPKFNVGQQVKIILCTHPEYRNKIGIITSIDSCGNPYVKVDGLGTLFHAPYALEPYTKPETKDNMEETIINDPDIAYDEVMKARINNMEEKELNLCELLKGCEGETFFSLIDGEVKLKQLTDDVICQYHKYHRCGYLFGCALDGVIMLYPSRALYEKYPLDAQKAWQIWAEERKRKYNVKVIVECWQDNDDNPHTMTLGASYSSEEEAQQAAEAVRECLAKFQKAEK